MTNSMLLAVLLQFVVSTKAGLVNHVQGKTNVAVMDQVRQGEPIRTGPNGYAEILLTPGSFLRLDENSEAVLDDVDLSSVAVHVVSGAAVIEVVEIDKAFPIRITNENLATAVAATGIYRFSGGVATVIEGKIQTGDARFTYGKGWQLLFKDNYRAKKGVPLKQTGLDVYSKARSAYIADANASAQPPLTFNPNLSYNYWLYSPIFGAYTFIPRSSSISPYGYRYFHIAGSFVRGPSHSGGGGSGPGSPSPSNPATPTTPSTPAIPVDGGGGGGGTTTATAIPVSAPAGQQTTAPAYIESKNAPAAP